MFMESMLASFPFSNGLGTSLPLSHVKNLVIGNGRMWFLYSKWRLLTQHILQVIPGPFPDFWVGPGDKAIWQTFNEVTCLNLLISNEGLVETSKQTYTLPCACSPTRLSVGPAPLGTTYIHRQHIKWARVPSRVGVQRAGWPRHETIPPPCLGG